MPQYTVDEDLALRVETLARRKPFENLTFNEALRRVLDDKFSDQASANTKSIDAILAEAKAIYRKKAPSPKPSDWLKNVQDLKDKCNLNTWKSICDALNIDTAGDSARRRLKKWVEANKPHWPEVPDA